MPQSYGVEESCRNTEGGSSTSAPVLASSNCSRSHSASPITPPPRPLSAPKEVIVSFVWDDGSLPLALPINQKIGMDEVELSTYCINSFFCEQKVWLWGFCRAVCKTLLYSHVYQWMHSQKFSGLSKIIKAQKVSVAQKKPNVYSSTVHNLLCKPVCCMDFTALLCACTTNQSLKLTTPRGHVH